MRGHCQDRRAAKRRCLRPDELLYCRVRGRPAHCSARQASASSAPCLQSSAPAAASILRVASRPWHVRSTLRRPAQTAQPPAAVPAAIAQSMPWKYMYWTALIARYAPACLRGPDWAGSLQPACFCLLGASEVGSDFSNGGLRTTLSWWRRRNGGGPDSGNGVPIKFPPLRQQTPAAIPAVPHAKALLERLQ
jgi:hypothetical protein